MVYLHNLGILKVSHMKTIIKYTTIVATLSFIGMGCAWSQKLPSVTVGGAANKDAALDASLSKSGASVTVPLVNVNVPFPSVSKTDEKE